MGDKADEIMCTLALSEEDRVKEAFEKHFVWKHNVIYERSQEPGESAAVFITAVLN